MSSVTRIAGKKISRQRSYYKRPIKESEGRLCVGSYVLVFAIVAGKSGWIDGLADLVRLDG